MSDHICPNYFQIYSAYWKCWSIEAYKHSLHPCHRCGVLMFFGCLLDGYRRCLSLTYIWILTSNPVIELTPREVCTHITTWFPFFTRIVPILNQDQSSFIGIVPILKLYGFCVECTRWNKIHNYKQNRMSFAQTLKLLINSSVTCSTPFF